MIMYTLLHILNDQNISKDETIVKLQEQENVIQELVKKMITRFKSKRM